MKESPREFFAARVDPEVLEILKAEAEARGVKVSAIAREAFDEWIARHVENRCPWCGAVNLPGADWCGSCTSPLSPAAFREGREAIDRQDRELSEIAKKMAQIEAQHAEILKLVGPRDEDQGPARAGERPRPSTERTLSSEEET